MQQFDATLCTSIDVRVFILNLQVDASNTEDSITTRNIALSVSRSNTVIIHDIATTISDYFFVVISK